MSSDQIPHVVYQKHRDSQREQIVTAAETLFVRDGIDSITIGQVAKAARISRVTLYEYFPDKKEIAWAVFQKVVGELAQAITAEEPHSECNGFERLQRYILAQIRSLDTHPSHSRYIALFNYLYAREGSPKRMRVTLEESIPGLFEVAARMIKDGMADGSIRSNLDPGLVSASIGNLLAGMNNRFALLGSNIPEEYGYDVADIYREIWSNFLRGLQPH